MTAPDFDLTDDELRRAGTIKWRYRDDVLPAWVAEMDVRPCPPIAAALRDAVERGELGYPMEPGIGLPEALAGFAAQRLGWTVDPASVVQTGDVISGIRITIETLCEQAPVVVPTPSYPPFLAVVPLTGRPMVQVRCLPGDDGLHGIRLMMPGIHENEHAKRACREHPDRFAGIANVNPNTGTLEFSLRDPDGYYVTISALSAA